jgi:predicted nucleic acid-binding protein
MTSKPKYLLDANALMEAHRRYYAVDICPGFWDFLDCSHKIGNVFSIDRVAEEIQKGKGRDFLKDWTEGNSIFFMSTNTPETIRHYGEMNAWVASNPQFLPEAKAEFASVADAWLMAHALAKGYILVTHEQYNRDIKKKAPIPNVCRQFGIQHFDTFQMLRDLKARFVLKN